MRGTSRLVFVTSCTLFLTVWHATSAQGERRTVEGILNPGVDVTTSLQPDMMLARIYPIHLSLPAASAKEDPGLANYAAEVAERVAVLREETTKDSIDLLNKVDWYYDDRISEESTHGLEVPLDKEYGFFDYERIRANRRFRKVLEELSVMPAQEAGVLVAQGLDAALEAYRTRYADAWASVTEAVESLPVGKQRDTLGPAMRINDGAAGKPPTLIGTQLQVLALTLIAANLELNEARPQVGNVVREALRQREEAYARYRSDEKLKLDALVTLIRAGIYNRPILASAVVALTPGYDGVRDDYAVTWREGKPSSPEGKTAAKAMRVWWEEGRQPHEVAWETDELVPHDTVLMGLNPLRMPVDWSRGVGSRLRMLPPLDDQTFDSILRHAQWPTE